MTTIGREVDLLLGDADGKVAGIKVMASSTVRKGDFRGLALRRDRLGDRYTMGVLLLHRQPGVAVRR